LYLPREGSLQRLKVPLGAAMDRRFPAIIDGGGLQFTQLGWDQAMSSGELVIHIPGSKADIYDDGYKLNINLRAGDTPSGIGPLLLLRRLYSLNPARLGANASKRPVFTLACGRVLERNTVHAALRSAAVALGLDLADHVRRRLL